MSVVNISGCGKRIGSTRPQAPAVLACDWLMARLHSVSPHEFINEVDITVEMDVSVLCVSCCV